MDTYYGYYERPSFVYAFADLSLWAYANASGVFQDGTAIRLPSIYLLASCLAIEVAPRLPEGSGFGDGRAGW